MTRKVAYAPMLTGLLLAATLTLYMNGPFLFAALTVPDYSPLHMGEVDEDRAYYLSRIKEAAEGHWLIGNSALFEHRFDVSPNGFVEVVTAGLMRITGRELGAAVLFTGVLFPFVILVLTFLWMERLLRSRLGAAAALLSVWFAVFGMSGLLRESSPKMTMVLPGLYLFILFCTGEGRTQRMCRGSLIGLMMYSYHYHWTLLFVFEGLLLLHALLIERRSLWKVISESLWIWIPLFTIALPYLWRILSLQGNLLAQEMWRRFGMIETRGIVAPLLQFTTLSWAAALFGLRLTKLRRDRESLNLLLLLLAGLIAVNSHLMTGREAEFEGHYGRMVRLFTWTALFLCSANLLSRRRGNQIAIGVIVLITLNGARVFPGSLATTIQNEQAWQTSGKQAVFGWLSTHTPPESVVLAPFSLSSHVPLFTNNYVFMNYAARSFLVSDEELMERYIVQTTFFPEDREPIASGVQSVFGNYPGSLYSRTKRTHQLLTLFQEPFEKTIADFIPDQEKRSLLERVLAAPDLSLAAEYLQRYRIDYLISQKSVPVGLTSLFEPIDEVGPYAIYRWRVSEV